MAISIEENQSAIVLVQKQKKGGGGAYHGVIDLLPAKLPENSNTEINRRSGSFRFVGLMPGAPS